ncbi:hypothetical protein [Taibaiella koreensis]|uniref:hypothetical protein n=1 Tax=Taibaiella koreensis TaxID=1268548 RepID=UPI000E5A0939|nr:hypothetical protein [Taibaiella koreensis]
MRKTHLLLLGVICILLTNCSRNHHDLPEPEAITKLDAEKEIGKFVALAFKDKEARKANLSGALKQETGDYSMMSTTLIKAPALGRPL